MRVRPTVLHLAALLLCLHATSARASGQEVSGYVVDDGTGTALAEVVIRALDGAGNERASTSSDSTGWFAVRLPAGSYRFELSRLGYMDLSTEPVRVGRNENVTVELRMGPRAIPIEPVLVRARTRVARVGVDVFYQRMAQQRALGHGRFITRSDIDGTSVASANDLLARDPALMILARTRPGGQSTRNTIDVLVMRQPGLRHCYPAVFMDGIRIYRPEETDISALFQPESLEGVEIYPNPAFTPPELMDPRGCGSVALWTRRTQGRRFMTMRQLYIATGFVAAAFLLAR